MIKYFSYNSRTQRAIVSLKDEYFERDLLRLQLIFERRHRKFGDGVWQITNIERYLPILEEEWPEFAEQVEMFKKQLPLFPGA